MKLISSVKNCFAFLLSVIVTVCASIGITPPNMKYKPVNNPVFPSGGDPYVVERDGEYYYCYSQYNSVYVNKIESIDKITDENASKVYTAPEGTLYSYEYWAPELHYIQGEWYIYVAADDGNNENHRMYVLKGTSQDPTQPFEMLGKISDSSDKRAIDGTVLDLNGELYFVWSGWDADEDTAQNIYIAHMSNPYTVDSQRVLISQPEYDWEKVGEPFVNEGPAVLLFNGKYYIVYSASGSWTNEYCLGMLSLTGTDPLNAESWTKSQKPVFEKRERVAYGPGHCSFTVSPDGNVWMIYHANKTKNTGWYGRSVWIQQVVSDRNGNPYFGKPSRYVLFK